MSPAINVPMLSGITIVINWLTKGIYTSLNNSTAATP